jgi:RHS repeat-associated protein
MTEKIEKSTGDTTNFVYDIENKLVEVRRPGMLAKYTYDALGRRMSKEVNGEVKQFRYDRKNLIIEMDANNSLTANYTFGKWIDNPLMMQRNGNGYYYIKDGLGSVMTLTDSLGNAKHEYKYGVFGKIVEESGDSIESPFTFTSRELDKETGIYYYRARYYDAGAGRFLSEDEICFILHNCNLYKYVHNAPIEYRDPEGNISQFAIGAAAVGIIIYIGITKWEKYSEKATEYREKNAICWNDILGQNPDAAAESFKEKEQAAQSALAQGGNAALSTPGVSPSAVPPSSALDAITEALRELTFKIMEKKESPSSCGVK